MTSFRLGIKPTRRAATRFVSKARRKLQKAVVEGAKRGITQSDIAREIGVHRSLISRELRGEANISLGRFAEIAHALGGEPEIEIVFPAEQAGRNAPLNVSATAWQVATTGTTVSANSEQTSIARGAPKEAVGKDFSVWVVA